MVKFPEGLSLVTLEKTHNRKPFDSTEPMVNEWLQKRAKQSQQKSLSRTKVLIDQENNVVGYYTLVIGQINFDDLPNEINKKLPKTNIPAMKLAWLGVDKSYQGKSLGKRLVASALLDCYHIGVLAPFCAVLIDCLHSEAKQFYQHFSFIEVPGHNLKLALSWKDLERIYKNQA